MRKDFNFDRDDILLEAVHNCYREMFAKAQPAADWDNLIREYNDGKIDEKKDGPVYDRHYLSNEEFRYILDKYVNAYKIKSEWNDNLDLLKDYLTNGGSKDKYIEEWIDENGNHHPGYRGYEKVKSLKDQIKDIMNKFDTSEAVNEVSDNITNKVFELIDTCQDFYSRDIAYEKFINTLYMGATPTGVKEKVQQWWKDHYDVDVEIKDKNPLLLWEYDNYGDEMDEIMSDEYGDNWEQIWWDKYHKEQDEKKAQLEAKLKKLQKENK